MGKRHIRAMTPRLQTTGVMANSSAKPRMEAGLDSPEGWNPTNCIAQNVSPTAKALAPFRVRAMNE